MTYSQWMNEISRMAETMMTVNFVPRNDANDCYCEQTDAVAGSTVADAVVAVAAVVDGVNDDGDAFDGDGKCFYDYLNYSVCETLCGRDYKRHYLMAEDAVVPCDVLMLIWC